VSEATDGPGSRSAPEPADAGERRAPLAGIRVVAVEQYGAGPFGTMYLADLGAEIIKIEDPTVGGDVSRYIPPGQQGEDSLFFEAFNRGKRSIALDLKNPAGHEVFERLVGTADAVFSNLRGDQPERLGVTYAHLAHLNPRLVCVAITGYGSRGDARSLPGYDALIQAGSGWAALTGDPDGPPTKSGLSLADYVAGLTGALGLLAGILDARTTGRGRDIDTNLYDSALAMLSYPATWYLSSGFRAQRLPLSAHPSIIPFGFFQTADGYLAIACPKEKFFRALVAAIELPGLADDPRFASVETRRHHRAELTEILNARLAEASTESWLGRLRGAVPVAKVRSMEEALDVDELLDREMLAEFPHPSFGIVRSVAMPLHVGGYAPRYRAGPRLGEHAGALLESLGYEPAEIEALRLSGAFGSPDGARGGDPRVEPS
jgi:crotonobetainyl-CoA:carnitine CoA-transferase CaiB-like acyl-CoA transferase